MNVIDYFAILKQLYDEVFLWEKFTRKLSARELKFSKFRDSLA